MKETKGQFGRRKNVWTVAKNAYEKEQNLMVPITIHCLGNLAIFSLTIFKGVLYWAAAQLQSDDLSIDISAVFSYAYKQIHINREFAI